MKLLVLGLLLSIAAQAQNVDRVQHTKAKKSFRWLEVVDARVDVKTSELVVRINGVDCNSYFGKLIEGKSGKASFGPQHFRLFVASTQIGCGTSIGKRPLKIVRVKIPLDPADQILRIEVLDKILTYNTKRPLSEEVAVVDNLKNIDNIKSKNVYEDSTPTSGREGRTEEKTILQGKGTK